MALGGGRSFLMLLWKEELLKMNQQQPNPGLWEEDEGANYTFPKYWGVASGAWARGPWALQALASSVTQKASLTHSSPPPGA